MEEKKKKLINKLGKVKLVCKKKRESELITRVGKFSEFKLARKGWGEKKGGGKGQGREREGKKFYKGRIFFLEGI